MVLTSGDSATNRTYAEEAYFFVPMMLADALRQAGEYVAALDWARTVYDYVSTSCWISPTTSTRATRLKPFHAPASCT